MADNRRFKMPDGILVELTPSGKITETVRIEELPHGDTITTINHQEVYTARLFDLAGKFVDSNLFSLSLNSSSLEEDLRREYLAFREDYY